MIIKLLYNYIIKLLCTHIFNNYANDMGYWFDYIQDNETDVYSEIESILRYGTIKEKMKLLKGDL